MTTSEWIGYAQQKLKSVGIPSANLDSELILSKVLCINRTKLHAFPHKKMKKGQVFHANNFLNKRLKRIPLAYIFGEKEFYGRPFIVSTDTLVPRPESEGLIDAYKKVMQINDRILDVGTGSGILGITIKLLNTQSSVYASDISEAALNITSKNTTRLHADITILRSDLLSDIPRNILDNINILVANLPYVNKEWVNQQAPNELHYEPKIALYADDAGLKLIKKLIQQTKNIPKLEYLILEADPEQFLEIESFAERYGFKLLNNSDYTLLLKK